MTSKEDYDREETAREQAAAKGCRVVLPGDDELFIDVDEVGSWLRFVDNFARMSEYLHAAEYESRPSPSGREGRMHVVVRLGRPVESVYERILLQALLGSDLTREALSWLRAKRGEENPTLFFEKVGDPEEPQAASPMADLETLKGLEPPRLPFAGDDVPAEDLF